MNGEWIVFKDGRIWTDGLLSEEECIKHIKECINENDGKYSYKYVSKDEAETYIDEDDKMNKIKYIGWQPEIGEKYYFPDYAHPTAVSYSHWENHEYDINTKKNVGVFRTLKEAQNKSKELGWL